jgi:hypothetical protein
MLRLPTYLFVVSLSLGFGPTARSQDSGSQNPSQEPTQPTQPLPPSGGDQSGQPKQDDQPVPVVLGGNADRPPLTGATQAPLSPISSRSFLSPGVGYYGQLDSNAYNASGPYHFASINTIMGSLAAQKFGRNTALNLDYFAGRSFSTHNGAFNSTTQELGGSALWSQGRWDGVVADRLVYSSQAAFLGGVVPFDITAINSVAGLEQTGPVVLRNTFLPGQGVFTNFGPRLSDVALAQVNNHLTRRTFVTFLGNFNTLRFFNSGLIDSSAAGFQTGIGYQASRESTFAVTYRLNDLWYEGLPVSFHDNVVEFAYQRELGQRFTLQTGVGPEVTFIHDPGINSGPPSETRTSWTADAFVRYQLRRTTSLITGYDHYLTNGSGVFLGSVRDSAYGWINRQLSRVWTLNVTASYAHNRAFIPVTLGTGLTNVPSNAAYHSLFGGVELHRQLGRDAEFFFGYFGRYQTANYTRCLTGFCVGSNLAGNQVNFGFVWRLKPIPVS